MCYVLLDCFNAWAMTFTECRKANRVGGSGVEIACDSETWKQEWLLGRCVYVMPQTEA